MKCLSLVLNRASLPKLHNNMPVLGSLETASMLSNLRSICQTKLCKLYHSGLALNLGDLTTCAEAQRQLLMTIRETI